MHQDKQVFFDHDHATDVIQNGMENTGIKKAWYDRGIQGIAILIYLLKTETLRELLVKVAVYRLFSFVYILDPWHSPYGKVSIWEK